MSRTTEFVVKDCFGCPFRGVLCADDRLRCYYPGLATWVQAGVDVIPENCRLRQSSALLRVSYSQMTDLKPEAESGGAT